MFLGISGRQDLNPRPLGPKPVLYQAEPLPVNKSAPERSRTPNLSIRSQTLYPIELRAHMVPRAGSNPHGGHPPQDFKSCASACSATPHVILKIGAEDGFEPATPTLARLYSTTELLPQDMYELFY